jgi:hypothetical protein
MPHLEEIIMQELFLDFTDQGLTVSKEKSEFIFSHSKGSSDKILIIYQKILKMYIAPN